MQVNFRSKIGKYLMAKAAQLDKEEKLKIFVRCSRGSIVRLALFVKRISESCVIDDR